MKKFVILFATFILIFALTACSSDDGSNESDDSNVNNSSEMESETEAEDSSSEVGDDNYVPEIAVPDGLPVYPDAILYNDLISYGDNSWQWFYATTGSGNDIVEFFRTEFQNLGFAIDEEYTFAQREEFFATTADSVISVYWLDSDNLTDDVNEDTPERHYGIIVDLDGWNDR
ncbi:MAG TPA: hypothetical protein VJ916_08570 [Anaerovoracaceae bacterium]|nr:hypothetical protein [Anaerovoracaceae bacterium]